MRIRKVNQTPGVVATVVDNLNSDSAVDALSAKQGKTLNERTPVISTTEPTTDEQIWIKKTSKNLYNPKTDIELINQYRHYASGNIDVANGYVTLKIAVKPNTTYISSSDAINGEYNNLCYFDGAMHYIGGSVYNTDDKVFTTPSNCVYITIAIVSTHTWFQLEEGTTVTPYEPYIERGIFVKDHNGNYQEFITTDNLVKTSSIQPTHSEGVWFKKSKNMIKNLIFGEVYDDRYGEIVTGADWARTDYIEVKLDTWYIFSHQLGTPNGRINCFDENKYNIGTINNEAITAPFKALSGTKYIMVNAWWSGMSPEIDSWAQLEQNTQATGYEPYIEREVYTKNTDEGYQKFLGANNLIKVARDEPITGEGLWLKKGKNMIKNFYKGRSFVVEGTSYDDYCATTDFIEIERNTDYIFSNSMNLHLGGIYVCDENRKYIDRISGDNNLASFRVNHASAKYIIITAWSPNIGDMRWMQLEQGTVATSYEPYVTPTLYLKNEKGVYETFIKKDENEFNNRYLADERIVGHWKDGRNIYARTIYVASLPNRTVVKFDHNIPSVDFAWIDMSDSFIKANNEYNETTPIMHLNGLDLSEKISLWVDNCALCIYSNQDYSGRSAEITIRYVKP